MSFNIQPPWYQPYERTLGNTQTNRIQVVLSPNVSRRTCTFSLLSVHCYVDKLFPVLFTIASSLQTRTCHGNHLDSTNHITQLYFIMFLRPLAPLQHCAQPHTPHTWPLASSQLTWFNCVKSHQNFNMYYTWPHTFPCKPYSHI